MNYNINATVRADKKDKEGNLPIYVMIYHGAKKVAAFSIGYKVPPDQWNADVRRVNRKYKNAMLINGLIDKQINELEEKILSATLLNSIVDINKLLNKERIKDADFFTFAEKQIREKNYAQETRRNYSVYLDKLKAYKSRLRIADIDFQFLQGYEAYLRNELKNAPNTVWGNFKFLNTMTNDAIKSGYLVVDPFETFKRVSYKQTERTYLTAEELAQVEKVAADPTNADLTTVAHYFLFMAYTGLRFSDAIRFRSALHIIDGERIVIETQKTKKITNLLINDKIKPLAAFVDANRLTGTQEDFNRKLKIIAAAAGIKKKVSSHVARHSFGSSLVDLGVSVEVAKCLLAHGSAASTKVYYHLKSSNLDDAMRKFNK